MREAMLYEKRPEAKVRCRLCRHRCLIKEGERGICCVRENRGGTLYSLVFDKIAATGVDPIEKKPFFHFHPGTRALSLGCYGCNVLCSGCQNWQISHASARTETARLPVLTPADALAMARKHKLSGVAFTYNDPAVWIEYVHDVCRIFKEAGLYTALVTAGYLSPEAVDYVGPFVDAVKFDLKAPTASGWAWLTKVKDPAPAYLAMIRAKEAHGWHVEVVSNIVPTLNDDDVSLTTMATWVRDNLGPATPWHVTRFLPDFELSYLAPTPIKVLERAVHVGREVGLKFVYVGNVPDHPGRHTVCPGCGRTVIRRAEQRVELSAVAKRLCVACGEDLNLVYPLD
jgi:pyruvate formate lyase activating enzyme